LLETGEADLAIGFMPPARCRLLPAKVIFSALTWHGFARSRACRSDPSLDAYLAEGTCHRHAIRHGAFPRDARLLNFRWNAESSSKSRNYLGVANIIAHTDLLATVPLRLAELIANETAVRLFTLPFVIPEYQVKQHCMTSHQDWRINGSRAVLTDLFLESSGPTAAPDQPD